MEQLSLLQKIYLYGETLSSNELNQIVLYLNSSIEAINTLIAKNNSINEGHCEMRFKVSTQLPNAPASGSDGTSDGWSDTYTMPNTANGECSWMTLSFFNGDGVYGSWSTPVCITWGSVPGLRGPKGESGARGAFKSRVFKRLNSKPTTPTGGTYDNPLPTSGGWHDGIPSGLAIIWSSVCTFYGNGLSSGWSEPAAESDTDTLDIEFSPSSVQPDPPIGNTPFTNHESEGWYDPSSTNFTNVGVMIWRAERKVSNGVYNGNWTITRIVGEKGAKGDSGDDGGHYKFRYCNFTPTPGHTTPTKPTQGSDGIGTFGSGANATTWAIGVSDPNVNAGEFTYMTSCYVVGDNEYGTWDDPIRITGGEGMAGEDGSDIEFIYTVNNTGNLPDAPIASGLGNARIFTEDDWYGKDENGIIWTDNPTGISLENQYEYVAIREKPAGRGSSWSSYRVALWSKWGDKGQDGDGFEYIFLLSQEEDPSQIANPTPQNWSDLSSDYQTMNEYAAYLELHIPVGELHWWTDEPQSITSIYPYVYVSKRAKKLNGEGANATIPGVEATKMVWGQFSAPSLWCRYASLGSTGAHYEFRYCNFKPHSGQTKPTTPTTGSNGRGYFGSDSDTYGGYWGDSAADPDVEHKEYTYLTQCIFTPVEEGNDYYGEWSEPVRITGANGEPGADGTDIEFIYCQYGPNVWSNPVAPTVSDDATIAMDDWPNVDGHTPSKTINGITWYDNPQGVNESNHKYEYMCQRIKPKGSLSWEPYNGPVIWSAYGEKGQDGDGYEYIFKHFEHPQTWANSVTNTDAANNIQGGNDNPNNWATSLSGFQNRDFCGPSGHTWSDDPQGISSTYLYEYVSTREYKLWPGETEKRWGTFSVPTLWSNYALASDGGNYEFRYTNTSKSSPTKPTTGSDGIGSVGSGANAVTWSRTPATLSSSDIKGGVFTYMTYGFKFGDGTYGEWSTPVRITGANGEDGADGSDIEFIYTRNNTGTVPYAPTSSGSGNTKVFSADDWFGLDNYGITWTDNPTGVEQDMRYEYIAVREKPTGTNQSWGVYTVALWSKYGEKGMDGDGYEYIYKTFANKLTSWHSTSYSNPANWPVKNSPDYTGPYSGDWPENSSESVNDYRWSDDPLEVDDTNNKYLYMSVRKRTNGTWGTFTEPKLWNNYAEAGATVPGPPGDIGPMSYLAGIWSSSITYTKTSRLNPIVYYPANDSYYYLKNEGSSTGDNPAGTGMTYTEQHSNPWLQAENYNMVFTDILFVNQFAKLGSFIVNQDWMLCHYGTIYDYNSGAHPILNTTDSISTDASHTYNYLNAYLLFDPAYPDKKKPNNWNFVPNYAINAVTGEIYCNNAHITGEVTATSGTFTGVVNASDGIFNGIVNATSGRFSGEINATKFIAGDLGGLNITTTGDAISFNYGAERRAWFTTKDPDGNDTGGMYLYLKNPDNPNTFITIDFANLKFKNTSVSGSAILQSNIYSSITGSPLTSIFINSSNGLYYSDSQLTLTLIASNYFEKVKTGIVLVQDGSNYRLCNASFYLRVQFSSGTKSVNSEDLNVYWATTDQFNNSIVELRAGGTTVAPPAYSVYMGNSNILLSDQEHLDIDNTSKYYAVVGSNSGGQITILTTIVNGQVATYTADTNINMHS